MVDVLKDIETLENALIAFAEGASDEKYAAIWSLEKMLLAKKDQVREFEEQNAPQEDLFNNVPV